MRFLSLFSGIEAASVAWGPMGWECVAVAEIEKFPCAVLAQRYPDVPNLGDVTKITREQIESLGHIDVVVMGFPCQDVSVAGQRKGLKNADGTITRSGLFFTAMQLAEWSKARWIVGENVPGLFSANEGRDFAAVVGELAGTTFDVPENGWRNTGVALGPRGLVEWAVLDAQWFGLAQRRERVFVVGYLGNWSRAAAVLFERESLRGDPPPRREAGQRVAPCVESRANGGGGGWGTDFLAGGGMIASHEVAQPLLAKANSSHRANGESYVAHALRAEGFDASEDGTGRGTPLVPVAFDTTQITHPENRSNPQPGGPCHPLAAEGHGPAIAFSCKDSGQDAGELSPTLRSMNEQGGNANAGGQVAVEFQTRIARNGRGQPSEIAGALSGADAGATSDMRPCVAVFQQSSMQGKGTIGYDKGGVAKACKTQTDGQMIHAGTAVRRLTPKECERLQGFQDGYTLIEFRGKPAADGPRYKALGNSMAVPCMRWLGERIELVEKILK